AAPAVTPPVATSQPPLSTGPLVTPPAALLPPPPSPSPAASEAHDYADAEAEAGAGAYAEIPAERPPSASASPSTSPAAGAVKPPVKAVPAPPPAETQVAALPTPPRSVFEPAPKAFDGEAPWVKYAVPSPAVKGRPMIAIVIDDLGVDKVRSNRIVTLPGPLTTAWMTYADNVAAQAKAARAAGHELIIHMPMEPLNGSLDSGPDVLKTTMTPDQVRRQVRAGLSRLEGYVGINNHMGSRFTTDPEGMRVVIDELRARGLLWLDSKTSPRSVGPKLAEQAGIPFAERHIFLDNVDTLPAVMAQLAETEKVARKVGYAIAIGHPHDSTYKALKQWLPSLEDKGLVLVPLSTIVRKRMGHG
ncbi:divergent polysaccharide deacetylase family protein, partial [Caenispirillum bisanense]|uniref:divergent polysaccharide deacetylase family protein n=1 Tax=Caenispirillum bisanense TaxID=414052 RepID=UPI0031DABA1D